MEVKHPCSDPEELFVMFQEECPVASTSLREVQVPFPRKQRYNVHKITALKAYLLKIKEGQIQSTESLLCREKWEKELHLQQTQTPSLNRSPLSSHP